MDFANTKYILNTGLVIVLIGYKTDNKPGDQHGQ